MTDFTITAPGTVSNPYVPPGTTIFGNGLASTAVGIHGHNNSNPVAFCDSRAYGNVIDITMTMAQVNSGGDDWFIGVVILSGPNAGAMIGLFIQSVDCILASFTAPVASTKTNIGSTGTTITTAANDVFTLRMTLSGGVWTFSNFTQNGSALALVGPTTSSTYASEPAWSAGGWLDCGNTNNTFFHQFTGNGLAPAVTVVQSVNSTTVNGNESVQVTIPGVTAGNTLAILGSFYNASAGAIHTPPTIRDVTNGLVPLAVSVPKGTSAGGITNIQSCLWYEKPATSGSITIKADYTADGITLAYASLTVVEIAGLVNNPVDAPIIAAANGGSSQGANATSGSELSTTSGILLAAVGVVSTPGTANIGLACSGFTSLTGSPLNNTVSAMGVMHCYQIYSAESVPAAAFTWTDSGTTGSQAVIGALSGNPVNPPVMPFNIGAVNVQVCQ